MKKYVIVPDCFDHNRGDQALVWEAIRLAKEAGMDGTFYVQGTPELCKQSNSRGYQCFNPLLPHPSRNKRTDNVHYGYGIILRWGIIALFDFIRSLYMLLIANCPLLFWTLPKDIRNSMVLFRESSALIVKGGGFLQTFGRVTDGYFAYYHIYSLLFANRIGLPIYVMPNSFGPLDGFLVKWQVKKALKKCRLIYCRESISYDYMTKTFPKISFNNTYDLGFYVAPQEPLDEYNFWKKRKKVAITVRPYRFPEHTNGQEYYKQYICAMIGLSKHIINKGFFPVFVQHVRAVNTHEDDMTAISDIVSQLPSGQYDVFSDENYNCQQLKSLYSFFDYIVGTRFHSVIFSLASCVPALSIAYGGNKSRGIMRDIGLERFVINIDEVTDICLIDLFERLIAESDKVRLSLKEIIPHISKERDTIVNEIKDSVRL